MGCFAFMTKLCHNKLILVFELLKKIMSSGSFDTHTFSFTVDDLVNTLSLSEVGWDTTSKTVVWQETRKSGGALVAQTQGENPRDLVRDLRLGGGVGYGGGGFTVGGGQVVFVQNGTQLYTLPLRGGKPRPLTPAFGHVASPSLSPDSRWVVYVHEEDGQQSLAITHLDGKTWSYQLLKGYDFIMQPTWHPHGTEIACITWDAQEMPWQKAQLHRLVLGTDEPRLVETHTFPMPHPIAYFQPCYSPNGQSLAYLSDQDGWWRVYIYDLITDTHTCLTADDEAEYGVAAWLQSMRTLAWRTDSNALYALRHQQARVTLVELLREGQTIRTVEALGDYSYLEQIAVCPLDDTVALIGGNSTTPEQVLTWQTGQASPVIHRMSAMEHHPSDTFATPEDMLWDAPDGTQLHGLLYTPKQPNSTLPPLIVQAHSGPTTQKFHRFDGEVQLLVAHGYAVLQVNYRGSMGYGRAFRMALSGQWGVVDAVDCMSGAQHLIEQRAVHPHRIAIMGSSAGGYTALHCLIQFPTLFKVGVARATVCDPFMTQEHTHRFEARYNDFLLGALPDHAPIWLARSPLRHADQLRNPLALFHGNQDTVVQFEQAEAVAQSLKRRGIPLLYKLMEGAGHSFRKAEHIQDYMSSTLQFLQFHLVYGVQE